MKSDSRASGVTYDVQVFARRQFIVLAILGLSGCRNPHHKVIAVVPKATSHLFFVSVHAGVDQAARDFAVDVLWNGPTEETDFSRQIEIVDALVARRVDALAI